MWLLHTWRPFAPPHRQALPQTHHVSFVDTLFLAHMYAIIAASTMWATMADPMTTW